MACRLPCHGSCRIHGRKQTHASAVLLHRIFRTRWSHSYLSNKYTGARPTVECDVWLDFRDQSLLASKLKLHWQFSKSHNLQWAIEKPWRSQARYGESPRRINAVHRHVGMLVKQGHYGTTIQSSKQCLSLTENPGHRLTLKSDNVVINDSEIGP